MQISDFAAFVANTWKSENKPFDEQVSIAGLGLAGETGESVEHIKKYLRDGKPIGEEFKLELGDVLYYIFKLAELNGFTVDDVIKSVVAKLNDRREKNGQDRVTLNITEVTERELPEEYFDTLNEAAEYVDEAIDKLALACDLSGLSPADATKLVFPTYDELSVAYAKTLGAAGILDTEAFRRLG